MSTARNTIDDFTQGRLSRRGLHGVARWGRRATAISAAALASGALAGPALAAAATPPDISANYSFTTLNNDKDTTFNQLLGINDTGQIAGYFGSGMTNHPNKGYTLSKPYAQGDYTNENFPGSAQTQVTGLDNSGVTVGFWVDTKGTNNGFYALRGKFHTVNFPTSDNASPKVDQLLGVNDSGVAAGFYTDGKATNHGFTYSIAKQRFHTVHVAGDTNVTAAAINNFGDVAGFATNGAGTTEAYLLRSDGKVFHLDFPGATATQAFGVSNGDEVAGDYTIGTGSGATTTGFVWAPGFGFQTVNDPNGIGTTTVNGVNDRGTLVGFYTDSGGNTDGFIAKPSNG